MNRNLQIILLVISTGFGSLFGMEKPEVQAKASKLTSMAEIALKAADTCYFGLDNQPKDLVKAAELYKRVVSNNENIINSCLASHMLTVMAFAGQGGLSLQEWKKYAEQTYELRTEINKNQDLQTNFLTAGLLRFSRILKITPESMQSIIQVSNVKEKMGTFLTYLQCVHLSEINKVFLLHTVNNILKNPYNVVNFENSRLPKFTQCLAGLTEYFDWHIHYKKEVEGLETLFAQENMSLPNFLEPVINLQQVIKIEAEILKDVSLELVTNLASLFYFKKIKNEDASNALECLRVAAKAVRNDEYVRSISSNISNNPLDALNVIGSFYLRKTNWLNLERAQEYLRLANDSKSNKILADAFCAMGEVYWHGLGTLPDYKKALECFNFANNSKDNFIAQARSALALGHLYFHGDIKNSNPDATPPNYKLAEIYLRSAFNQNYVPRLKPHAAILLGHIYHYGNGVAVDLDEALTFYTVAASQFSNLPLRYRAQKEAYAIRSQKDLEFFNQVD